MIAAYDLISGITNCAPLQIDAPARAGSTSCIGDTITYICTVSSQAHTWSIASLGVTVAITRAVPMTTSPPVTVVTTGDDGTSITTALTVTAVTGLDGANITCVEGVAGPQDAQLQEVIASVFGEQH